MLTPFRGNRRNVAAHAVASWTTNEAYHGSSDSKAAPPSLDTVVGVVRLGQALDLAEPACWAVAPERCSFHVHDAVALVQTSYGRPGDQGVARVDPNLADPDHGCLWVLLLDGDLVLGCSAHVPSDR